MGLICGVLFLQGLSFSPPALFGTTMTNYQFVFPDAFLVTLACFAAIYVVVAAFNTITVSRCKLIDLIRAGEKNERAGVRATRGSASWGSSQRWLSSSHAYEQLIENGLVMLDQPEFIRATIAMLVGSLLFFWSLAGRHCRAHAAARRVPAQAEPVHRAPDR